LFDHEVFGVAFRGGWAPSGRAAAATSEAGTGLTNRHPPTHPAPARDRFVVRRFHDST